MFERKAELDKTLSQKKHLSILKAEKENFLIADEGILLDEDLTQDIKDLFKNKSLD